LGIAAAVDDRFVRASVAPAGYKAGYHDFEC
jgi:hypothetical protein